jgi:hypothetical protein
MKMRAISPLVGEMAGRPEGGRCPADLPVVFNQAFWRGLKSITG